MDSHFDFLKHAKPASLCKLLERLPVLDAAVVLAGLPAPVGVQIMAYFPESRQGELMSALRQARREGPERASAVAARIRSMLAAAKKNGAGASGGAAEAVRETRLPPRPAPGTNPPALPSRNAGGPPSAKPMPWIPRAATSSPINGPAAPGKPPPVEGDPLRSPLARAGLFELLGRARDTLLPKGKTPADSGVGRRPIPPKPGTRPPAVEGRIPAGRIGTAGAPRVVGPKPKVEEKPGDGARRMDGKAILAAILREAGGGVRENVKREDPILFKELRGRMFHFGDLMRTDSGALARVFTAAPAAEAALALRFAAPALRDRVLGAVSPGRAEVLREVNPGRAGVDDIEAAQKKVLEVALQFQAAGRILIDPRDPDLAGA